MSVEYYLKCDKHKEYCHCSSDGLSGPLNQVDRSFPHFVISHRNCDLRVIDEHQVDDDNFDSLEIDITNYEEFFSYDKS
jgi:hypothetical protein